MQVPIREFYAEVTGGKVNTGNTATAQAALKRWGVPYSTRTAEGAAKQFWKVDVSHVETAKRLYAAEQAALEARRPKKKQAPLSEGMGIMERMSNVEQELRTLNTALMGFIKKFEP